MLPKSYEPKPIEEKFTSLWQERRLFISAVPEDKSKKSYVVVIPPPNITGALHMGHALNNTLQDAFIRYHRMTGREAYWVPGTDHGGIATQNVLEKKIAKERHIHRRDLGREKFVAELWAWYRECGGTILNQLSKLGCALDFSPENVRFTMDARRAKSVYEEFHRLWDKRLIYRGERMINWCVRCETALSDIEVEHESASSKLWHIHYPLEDGSQGLTVATTRPETMLGDTAVAVNPKDERYTKLVGKKLRLPLTDRVIPIIADDEVDAAFGTGAVKVTPAHDPADYEIGRRHSLPIIPVIDFHGKMQNVPAKYQGMDRNAARQAVVADLKEAGFLRKEEPYTNAVSTCYRCNQSIEPLVSEQWFVKMKDLAAPAINAAETGRVKFHPESWKKPYLDWLSNIQDWCISRQIWWGHRIPVWYCAKCSGDGLIYAAAKNGEKELVRISFKDGAKPVVAFDKPAKCPLCGGADLVQDPDVLDTWFSSALWPFSVFGWPEKTKELEYYYPTSLLVTGYEILHLWVARMVMMGIELAGDVPFSDVCINGIVRDKHGKKMSKSLGNVIDPLDLTAKYGTDAVRFGLITQAVPGRDIMFAEESITGSRNFCNKIYNAARFLQMNLPPDARELKLPLKPENLADRWILHRYNTVVRLARHAMTEHDPAAAAQALYHFLWDEYCDWYVELAKPRLQNEAEKDAALAVLAHVLYGTLKALHPFMPFITEELASALRPHTGSKAEFLLQDEYPQQDKTRCDEDAASEMEAVMGVTVALRTIRSQYSVPPALKARAIISSRNAGALSVLSPRLDYVRLLAKLEAVETGVDIPKPRGSATAVSGDFTLYMPLEGIIDFAKERVRLDKEFEKLVKEEVQCKARLADANFRARAPKEEVCRIEQRLAEAAAKMESIKASLADIANG
ncbi:MAG: valine--tRNA ligase [Elusimicrobiales bacterium]|nr:valine--tRNA ligase [Elusimicrobiales bacterium]